MFKKMMLFSMAAVFLFVGIISVNNANAKKREAIITRQNWENLESQYKIKNIKKGLPKNMGKAFDKFHKIKNKYETTNPKKVLKALNTLGKKLDKYIKSLKKLTNKKRMDKNLCSNLKEFYDNELKDMKKNIDEWRKYYKRLAYPIQGLKESLADAEKKYEQLTSYDDIYKYYNDELLDLGKVVQKLNKKRFKTVKNSWNMLLSKVNKDIRSYNNTDKATQNLLKDIKAALNMLKKEMKKK